MDKLWTIPNRWENKEDNRVKDVQVSHAVDSMIKYCENCDSCFEKRHYTERGAKQPYHQYEDFPRIGKERVIECPFCKE